MRKVFVFSLLSTLAVCFEVEHPQSAVAQPGCESLTGNAAIAQNCVPWIGRRSLTVIGQGLVAAPADSALMDFRFSSREPTNSDTSSTGLSIQTARQFTEDALKPAIDALRAAGVPASNITVQTSSIQNPKLLVRLDKPTQAGIQAIVQSVDQSLQANQQIFLQSIGAGYSVNNCETLEGSARRLALQDAQRQLKGLSQDVNVELGELLSVSVLPLVGSSNSLGCGTKVGVSTSPFSPAIDEATPPYNPSDPPQVQVKSQVSVTHAIQSNDSVPIRLGSGSKPQTFEK